MVILFACPFRSSIPFCLVIAGTPKKIASPFSGPAALPPLLSPASQKAQQITAPQKMRRLPDPGSLHTTGRHRPLAEN